MEHVFSMLLLKKSSSFGTMYEVSMTFNSEFPKKQLIHLSYWLQQKVIENSLKQKTNKQKPQRNCKKKKEMPQKNNFRVGDKCE
ncbi:hypothetical protein FK519_28750 [Klebsiella pneumoniae]|nr:hypothetical protein [Klebsiella pneumoniae]